MKFIIYFIHIVKTGGTSVRYYFHNNDIPYDSQDHSPFIQQRYELLESNYDKVIKMTVLRDPVQQIISLYKYLQVSTASDFHKNYDGYSFSEWIRKSNDIENYFVRYFNFQDIINPNIMSNFDGVSDSVDQAKNILNKFDYVFDCSDLTNQMNLMLKDIGVDIAFDLHLNQTEKYHVSKEDIGYIKYIRMKDYELLKDYDIKLIY